MLSPPKKRSEGEVELIQDPVDQNSINFDFEHVDSPNVNNHKSEKLETIDENSSTDKDESLLQRMTTKKMTLFFVIMILFIVSGVVIVFIVHNQKSDNDENVTITNVYDEIQSDSRVLHVGNFEVCNWTDLNNNVVNHDITINGESTSRDDLIGSDTSLIRGELCDTEGSVVLTVNETGVSGTITEGDKNYTLSIVDSNTTNVAQRSGADKEDNYEAENRSEKMQEWENKWDALFEEDASPSSGRSTSTLEPGSKNVHLQIIIDQPMITDFGDNEYEAVVYVVKLIDLVNVELYYPLGFNLKIVDITILDSKVHSQANLNKYLDTIEKYDVPDNIHLVHCMSTRSLGGGIAYIGGLYDQRYRFGISGNLKGNFDLWDIVVVGHELGHNFGSHHTHEYSPPIDSCGIKCPSKPSGTIMSYCHICSGGMKNVEAKFDSAVKEKISTVYGSFGYYLDTVVPCTPFMDQLPEMGVSFYLEDFNDNCIKIHDANNTGECSETNIWTLERVSGSEIYYIHYASDTDLCWTVQDCWDNSSIILTTCDSRNVKQRFYITEGYQGYYFQAIDCKSNLFIDGNFELTTTTDKGSIIHEWCIPGEYTSAEDNAGFSCAYEGDLQCGDTVTGSTRDSCNIKGNSGGDKYYTFTTGDTSIDITFDSCKA
eukprot:UN02765